MCVKLRSVCVKLHSVCVKLHTVCEITQCAQSYTYSIGKKISQLKNFTLTPWAAWATNISCVIFILGKISSKWSLQEHVPQIIHKTKGSPSILFEADIFKSVSLDLVKFGKHATD